MDMMKEKIETVFNALQELDIKATPHNVSLLSGVFDLLRDLYNGGDDVADCADGRDNPK